MVRKGKFGGMLGSSCILNPDKNNNHRLASAQIRTAAAKIGLQTLYAAPENALEKF
jgi:hypothetical protein